ncbi:MAG TPA: hypothetical protein DDW73_18080 [Rhizobium sp.]|jgi:hypothetical protein|nr:hypothetical protein [Rhizobium sp.]
MCRIQLVDFDEADGYGVLCAWPQKATKPRHSDFVAKGENVSVMVALYILNYKGLVHKLV